MSVATTGVTYEHAQRWAERARLDLEGGTDRIESGLTKIRTAIHERHDRAMPERYHSLTDYLAGEYGGALSQLGKVLGIEVRRTVVGELRDAGLSTRAIAAVTGTSNYTASKDRQAIESGVRSLTPEPTVDTETGEMVGDDSLSDDEAGEEVTSPAAMGPALAAGQPEEAPGEEVEPTDPAPSRPVTGLDGKTYTRPEPSKPKRRPLTDAFTGKRWAMQKALESLSRLTQDDRFPKNANQVATSNRSDLIRIKDQLQLVIDRLPENT